MKEEKFKKQFKKAHERCEGVAVHIGKSEIYANDYEIRSDGIVKLYRNTIPVAHCDMSEIASVD